MRPVTYVLLTLLVLLIGGKIYFEVRRKRVCFMRVRSEFLPDGFLNTVCPQLGSPNLPESTMEMTETVSDASERFHAIAENADPDAPNQAVLYIEDSNIVLVSSGVVARIARGDKWLARKVARWTENFEGALIIIANFGFFEYNNS